MKRDSADAVGASVTPASGAAGQALLEELEPRLLLAIAPTAYDTYLLELVNRGRADPAAEAARYGCDLNEALAPGTISTTAKQPLAFNDSLIYAAQLHSQWMLANGPSHTGSGGSSPQDRMADGGYSFVAPYGLAENWGLQRTTGAVDVIAFIDAIHENLYVDVTDANRGHRLNLMNPTLREYGTGVKEGVMNVGGTAFNTVMVCEDFAYRGTTYFLCGVAYTDAVLDDDFYTPGEGMENVQVTAKRVSDGKTFSTKTWSSGAYRLALEPGTYTVTGTGLVGGGTVVYSSVVISGANVKRDFTLAEVASNSAPTLTTVAPLTGAYPAQPYTITYEALVAAANDADADGQAVSFVVEGVTSGTLTKGGTAVVAGQTTLGAGESLVWKSATGANGQVNAFTVKATDGALKSATAVPVPVQVQGVVQGAPEILVKLGTAEIADGALAPVGFGTVPLGAAAPTLTFTVYNMGTAALTLGPLTLGANTGFEITRQPATSVAAGRSTTFTLRMTTTAGGAKAANVVLPSNDADENPYNFAVAGTVSDVPAEIEVRRGATVLLDGAAAPVDFGTVAMKSVGPEIEFTVNNLGGMPLTLGTITLANSVGFAVTKQPDKTVAPGGSTTFRLRMDAGAAGAKAADVLLTSNDGDESPFDFKVAGTVTMTNVGVTALDAAASEQGPDTATFRLARTGALDAPLTVRYRMSGTAGNGTDYRYLDGSVTFMPGAATLDLTLVPIDDLAIEAPETATLTLYDSGGVYGYLVAPGLATGTATIADNEPTLSVSVPQAAASENPGDVGVIRITRSNVGFTDLKVAYTLTGTARNFTDYDRLTSPATIPAGATFVDIIISAVDDWLIEPAETAILTLSTGTGYVVDAANRVGTVTIADNEPMLSIAALDPNASETGANTATLRITRSNVGPKDLKVYLNLSGTASSGWDFAALGDPVIPAGATFVDVFVTPVDDQKVEGNETVIATLSTAYYACGYTVNPAAASATATIADNEPVVGITAPDAAMAEEGRDGGRFTVTRSNVDPAQDLTVWYTIGGTALNYGDYAPAGGTGLTGIVVIPAGQTSVNIDVTPDDDAWLEGDETVILTLRDFGPGSAYTVDAGAAAATGIITDNEPTVRVTVQNPAAAEEGSAPGVFRIWRTAPGATALPVRYRLSGAAWSGDDFPGPVRGSLLEAVIPAGETFVDVAITPTDDMLVEGDETVTLTLEGNTIYESYATLALRWPALLPRYTIDAAAASATLAIADNEPTVTLVAADPAASEAGPDTGRFRVSRSAPGAQDLTVRYVITGTATNGTDYNAWPNNLVASVVIPAGETVADILITPADDAWPEPAETVTLTLSTSTQYIVGAANTGTVTIADNEPTVGIAVIDAAGAETGPDTLLFRFTRSEVSAAALRVNFTIGGTAANGFDYDDLPANINRIDGFIDIPANQTTVDLVVTPRDDAVTEPDETVILTLKTSSLYTVDALASAAQGVIADNEPTVSIVAIDADASEPGTDHGRFRVTMSRAVPYTQVINYTVGGTASRGSDYATTTGHVTGQAVLAAGETTVDIEVAPYNDALAEGDETVILTLQNSIFFYTSATQNTAVVTIHDDEPVAGVTAIDPTAAEGGNTGTFRIWRTAAGSAAATVGYTLSGTARNGTDYATLPASAVIPAGQTFVDVIVNPVDDGLIEAAETVIMTLKPSSAVFVDGASSSATVTILDNEPTVGVAAVDAAASEQGPDKGVFRFTRSAAGGADLAVRYTVAGTATGGTDYAKLTGTAVIPGGQTFVDVDVTPVDDVLAEAPETVIVNLSASTAYHTDAGSPTATVTIADNEPTVSVTATDAAASEQGPDTGMFRITRPTPGAADLAVSYTLTGTAKNGTDYVLLSGKATIPAGQTAAFVTVTPLDDSAVEAPETVILTLGASASYVVNPASNTATVTIADNEPAVSLTVTDAAASEGAGNKGTFRVQRSNVGATNLSVPVTITGTASNGADYVRILSPVVIPAGQTSVLVDVLPLNDTLLESAETVIMTLGAGASYTLNDGAKQGTVTIADAAPVVVSITAPDAAASETAGNTGTFRVSRSYAGWTDLSVPLTIGGTATGGTDYAALPTTAVIPAGQTFVDLTVTPVDDALAEPAETVIATLKTPSSGYVLNDAAKTATVTIADNEPTLSVSVPDDYATEDAGSQGVIRISRGVAGAANLTVLYTMTGTAANGTDYVKLAGTAVIPAGATYVDVVVLPVDDAVAEGNETATLTLRTSTSYTVNPAANAGSVTIADNEPVVQVTAWDASASEATGDLGWFAVTRSVVSNKPLTVYYTVTGTARAGTDYQAISGSVTIGANDDVAWISVRPYDDELGEGTETVVVTLKGSTAFSVNPAMASATVNIIDNEFAPDAYEPDNTWSQATPIVSGVLQTHNLHQKDDMDWYRFSVTGNHMWVTIVISCPGSNLRMSIFSSKSLTQPVYEGIPVPGGYNSWFWLDTGTYYIKLHEDGKNAPVGNYTINVTLS
jgi:hypothetical protein